MEGKEKGVQLVTGERYCPGGHRQGPPGMLTAGAGHAAISTSLTAGPRSEGPFYSDLKGPFNGDLSGPFNSFSFPFTVTPDSGWCCRAGGQGMSLGGGT